MGQLFVNFWFIKLNPFNIVTITINLEKESHVLRQMSSCSHPCDKKG